MNIKENISKLDLDDKVANTLEVNNIFNVEDLWVLSRNDLKEYGLNDNQINHIIIKLELRGIGLNKKIYDNYKVRN